MGRPMSKVEAFELAHFDYAVPEAAMPLLLVVDHAEPPMRRRIRAALLALELAEEPPDPMDSAALAIGRAIVAALRATSPRERKRILPLVEALCREADLVSACEPDGAGRVPVHSRIP